MRTLSIGALIFGALIMVFGFILIFHGGPTSEAFVAVTGAILFAAGLLAEVMSKKN